MFEVGKKYVFANGKLPYTCEYITKEKPQRAILVDTNGSLYTPIMDQAPIPWTEYKPPQRFDKYLVVVEIYVYPQKTKIDLRQFSSFETYQNYLNRDFRNVKRIISAAHWEWVSNGNTAHNGWTCWDETQKFQMELKKQMPCGGKGGCGNEHCPCDER